MDNDVDWARLVAVMTLRTWLDSGCILRVEPVRAPHRLDRLKKLRSQR